MPLETRANADADRPAFLRACPSSPFFIPRQLSAASSSSSLRASHEVTALVMRPSVEEFVDVWRIRPRRTRKSPLWEILMKVNLERGEYKLDCSSWESFLILDSEYTLQLGKIRFEAGWLQRVIGLQRILEISMPRYEEPNYCIWVWKKANFRVFINCVACATVEYLIRNPLTRLQFY